MKRNKLDVLTKKDLKILFHKFSLYSEAYQSWTIPGVLVFGDNKKELWINMLKYWKKELKESAKALLLE